uniref:ethanolamine kinase n=1 Tax=Taeniopygia guttata TaxID=59729 RepID=A0A674HP95_TAEGU
MKETLPPLGSPVVLCHNDLLCKNIIYDSTQERVRFIDYEYTGYNYQAFDIGNHFNEFAGGDCPQKVPPVPRLGNGVSLLRDGKGSYSQCLLGNGVFLLLGVEEGVIPSFILGNGVFLLPGGSYPQSHTGKWGVPITGMEEGVFIPDSGWEMGSLHPWDGGGRCPQCQTGKWGIHITGMEKGVSFPVPNWEMGVPITGMEEGVIPSFILGNGVFLLPGGSDPQSHTGKWGIHITGMEKGVLPPVPYWEMGVPITGMEEGVIPSAILGNGCSCYWGQRREFYPQSQGGKTRLSWGLLIPEDGGGT